MQKKLSICVLLFTALLRAHCQIDIAKGFIAGQDLAKKQCDSTGIAQELPASLTLLLVLLPQETLMCNISIRSSCTIIVTLSWNSVYNH